MPWVYLFIAGLLEVVWSYSMKLSLGFTKTLPSVITILTMIMSFWLLSVAMKSIPLGSAYTIWTGIGAVGAFSIGIIFLGEPINFIRIIAALFIITGLVLMKFS